MASPFQQTTTNQPGVAVRGDFASQNPYYTFDAGPGGLVAGVGGVDIGYFAWAYPPVDVNGTTMLVQSNGGGPVSGFVHREQQGLITTYLADSGMKIQPGFQMGLMIGGDFWVDNDGSTFAMPGMKAFAKLASGKVQFAAAGTVIGGASATGSDIAAATFSTTGSVNNDVYTVTAVGSGTVYPGATIANAGLATGTKVVSQISGTPGGVGTYRLNVGGQTVAAGATITGTYGLLTIGTATGTFAIGDILTGTGISVPTALTAFITGSGGTGSTAAVDVNTVVASTTITASHAIETKWFARSSGPAGALIKISDQPLG
jgi:hypothetical protein